MSIKLSFHAQTTQVAACGASAPSWQFLRSAWAQLMTIELIIDDDCHCTPLPVIHV